MTSKLDFSKVESLRQHMLLRGEDMASLFQVSRMTYYSWVTGKSGIRKRNEARVKRVLKKLVRAVKDNDWPNPEAVAASPEQRKQLIKEYVERE